MMEDTDMFEYDDCESDNEEMDECEADFIISENFNLTQQEIKFNVDYKIVSYEEINESIDRTVKELSAITCLPKFTTRLILNHFKWNRDKILEKFYSDDYDLAKLLEDSHIIAKELFLQPFSNVLECAICFSEYKRSQMTGLNCGHKFCVDCWYGYLKNKIVDERQSQEIDCPFPECKILIDDRKLSDLLEITNASIDIKVKYKKLLVSSYVETNPLLRWCPSAGCDYAVRVPNAKFLSVICKCGHAYCFSCGELSHDPINCQILTEWIEFSSVEGQTLNWIQKNTKKCPGCQSSIEKNGGCNHMTCRKCRTEFCWHCLNLTTHNHQCNAYQANNNNNNQSKQELTNRFTHFNDRYVNHRESLKLETEQYFSIRDMTSMELPTQCYRIDFVQKAVDTLLYSRRTLMYTYAFAFFVETQNNNYDIFVGNQKDLENATEKLSQFLENHQGELSKHQSVLTDMYKYCEYRCHVLSDHVREGLENDTFILIKFK